MLRVSSNSRHCFTAHGTQAALYTLDDTQPSSVVQSWQTSASVTALDWSSNIQNQAWLALGYSSGDVDVLRPFQSPETAVRFPAARQRSCTAVAFAAAGQGDHEGSGGHQLAVGLDKVRHDYSLMIYNLETQQATGQYANSEGVSSLAWAPDAQHYLLAGLNYRWIRLIDLRQDSRDGSAISIPTKAAFNISVDAQEPNRFASTYGDEVCIWDRRATTGKPELSLVTEDRQRILSLKFSPRRRAHLAALCQDASLNVWQLDEPVEHGKLARATLAARRQEDGLRVGRHHVVRLQDAVAFDFCDRQQTGPLQLVAIDGEALPRKETVWTVKPALAMSCTGDMAAAFRGRMQTLSAPASEAIHGSLQHNESPCSSPRLGHPFLQSEASLSENGSVETTSANKLRDPDAVLAADMATIMRRRAVAGYGMDPSINLSRVRESTMQTLWRWVIWSRGQATAGTLRHGSLDFCYEGALNICSGSAGSLKRPNAQTQAHTEKFTAAVAQVNLGFSCDILPPSLAARETRQLALATTGWCLTHAAFQTFLADLLQQRQFDKAAFYAVAQHGQVEEAVEILMKGNSTQRIMSAAIAGYVAAKAGKEDGQRPFGIWQESCRRLAIELDSPYIRALFAFVSEGSWRDVLDEQGLSLRERISIAIRYLKEEEIGSVLKAMSKTETDEGNLEGLLLTGITTTSLDLLQRYVDRTGDVQTVALITSFKPELYEERQVVDWVAEYKHLLNSWGLFHARCRFDVMRNTLARHAAVGTRLPPRQIYVRCNHCGANLTHHRGDPAGAAREHGTATTTSAHAGPTTKATLCPSCRKPLPRCALCLLPLGTSPDQDTATCRVQDKASRTFDWSLNFCLRCNHGCHSEHALEWFAQSVVCPAAGCDCRCGE